MTISLKVEFEMNINDDCMNYYYYSRCKMRQKDLRLFYLSMEVMVRKAGVKTVLVLDDDARPAILQACHPKGDSR